jgi:hypothetical protein
VAGLDLLDHAEVDERVVGGEPVVPAEPEERRDHDQGQHQSGRPPAPVKDA